MTLGKSAAASAGSASGDTSGSCPKGMYAFTLQGNVRTGGTSS
jgi:hypothetical protein